MARETLRSPNRSLIPIFQINEFFKSVVDQLNTLYTNYINENGGSTGAIASGATVAHGLSSTPNIVSVLPKETGLSNVYVTVDATNLTINYSGGGTHDFWWEAKVR